MRARPFRRVGREGVGVALFVLVEILLLLLLLLELLLVSADDKAGGGPLSLPAA